MPDPSQEKTSALRRYGLVALGFIHIAVGRGLHGTFGVFFVAFLDAFGWSRAVTAGAASLAIIVEGIFHPIVGTLTDRIGGRKTLLLGGLVLAIGLAFSATVNSVWQLYFWVGVVSAAGISLIGMVPHVAIISRQYANRKATALGIAWAGGGVGIFVLVPVTAAMIANWGWASAYIGLAVMVAILVIPPVLFFIRADHEQAQGTASQSHAPGHAKHAVDDGDWTVKQALTNSSFWLLFGARVLASLGNQIIVTHQVAHAVDVGYPKIFAASIFGVMGVVSIAGRILFGYLADRMRRELVYTWVQAVSAVGTVALLATTDNSMPILLYAYAVFYGMGQGSRALVLSAISIDVFKGKNFGAIFGYFTLSVGVGGAIGAWLGGYLFDVTRSYQIAFSISLACLIGSVFVVFMSTRSIRAQSAARGA
ncbi:MAG: MFS transporter [Deltaproteobacteria bacterium]|nr:MFS transporter [Deltaproteobacteria bacterium]